MDDLISRQAAIDKIMSLKRERVNPLTVKEKAMNYILEVAASCIYYLPSAKPERKKGQWIRNDNGTYSCSVCQSWIPEEQHCYARYCLYCGADMRGEL